MISWVWQPIVMAAGLGQVDEFIPKIIHHIN